MRSKMNNYAARAVAGSGEDQTRGIGRGPIRRPFHFPGLGEKSAGTACLLRSPERSWLLSEAIVPPT